MKSPSEDVRRYRRYAKIVDAVLKNNPFLLSDIKAACEDEQPAFVTREAAKAIILVHNHPSGDPTPSEQDRQVTGRLEAAGKTLAIQILDHIIVARGDVISMQKHPAAESQV